MFTKGDHFYLTAETRLSVTAEAARGTFLFARVQFPCRNTESETGSCALRFLPSEARSEQDKTNPLCYTQNLKSKTRQKHCAVSQREFFSLHKSCQSWLKRATLANLAFMGFVECKLPTKQIVWSCKISLFVLCFEMET